MSKKITPAQRKAILDFFSGIDSHSVYDYDAVSKDFTEKTGLGVPWGWTTPKAVRSAMKSRPAGGTLSAKPAEKLCSGFAMAEAAADEWGEGDARPLFGLGSRFRDALRRLGGAS